MRLKGNVVALLVYTSKFEFNSRCAITIFHLYDTSDQIIALVSVRNKYHKYFLRGKGDQCEELTNLPPTSVFAIFSS